MGPFGWRGGGRSPASGLRPPRARPARLLARLSLGRSGGGAMHHGLARPPSRSWRRRPSRTGGRAPSSFLVSSPSPRILSTSKRPANEARRLQRRGVDLGAVAEALQVADVHAAATCRRAGCGSRASAGGAASGVWPPWKCFLLMLPLERAFWPFWPRPAVLPRPEPTPRPTRSAACWRLRAPGAWRGCPWFVRFLLDPLPYGCGVDSASISSHLTRWITFLTMPRNDGVLATTTSEPGPRSPSPLITLRW